VRLGILRSGSLARANLGAMLFVGSFFAFQFVVVLYLQELRGWSALETGLALLVAGIDMVLAPTVTPRLVSSFGTVRVALAGMVLAAAAYALFLPVGVAWSYAQMLPTFVLIGLAFSLTYGALTIAATQGIAEEEQGLAGGLLNVSLQFGAALGLAVATAINVAATEANGSPQALLDGYQAALVVPVAGAVAAVGITALGLVKRARRAGARSDCTVRLVQ
jgi:predicted MFS family arabinose efflux permease